MEGSQRSTLAPSDFVIPGLPLQAERASGAVAEVSDTMAPLIFNAWYVIALKSDVGEALQTITVLDQPLVFYRTQDGAPVVLDDRCVHRKFSLAMGRRKGDTIECGYHGYTFDQTGQCVWAPGVPMDEGRERKLKFGVRSYRCAEKGPWLWVWMGDPELADPADIPLPEMQCVPESTVSGYKLNPCNYMMLIENLLDLSHAHFLHRAMDLKNVAVVPDDAEAPKDGVSWRKYMDATEMGLSAKLCGGDPERLARGDDRTTQFGPALTFGHMRREALPGQNEPLVPALMQIAHATTPRDARSTHQFFTLTMSDPFVIDIAQVQKLMEDIVFEEDVVVLGKVQAYNDSDTRPGRVEFSMAYDRFGLEMRKILREMKERELAFRPA